MLKNYVFLLRKNFDIMTVVSTKEFNSDQKKYFALAINEEVCIKRNNRNYFLMLRPIEKKNPKQVILEPDDNLRRSITAEELLERIHGDIHKKFETRK